MAKDEFDRYLCAGGRGGGGVEAVIFSFDKSTSLEGGQKKNPEMIRGLPKNERKK